MKRYAVHLSTTAIVECENALQAKLLAQRHYRLIGARMGLSNKRKERDPLEYQLHAATLTVGRPIRLPNA
jgi:hypothetical protein